MKSAFEEVGFKPSPPDTCMFYVRGTIALIYVDDVLFFSPEQDKIYELINKIEDAGILLTVEQDVYDFLGVEVNTDKQSGKVALTQWGLTKKVLNTVGILDSNKKITPATTIPLATYADGHIFDDIE